MSFAGVRLCGKVGQMIRIHSMGQGTHGFRREGEDTFPLSSSKPMMFKDSHDLADRWKLLERHESSLTSLERLRP
jgi:hypothetical protein